MKRDALFIGLIVLLAMFLIGVFTNLSTDKFSLTGYITSDPSSSTCDVKFNETSPIEYGNAFIVWTDCTTEFTLYKNSSIISNNSVQSLGASTYNFTVIRTDSVDYSNYYDEETFVINKATPTATLTNDTAWIREYDGTNSSIGISESNTGDGDVTYILWRDDINVSSSDSIGAVGSYTYKINTTGGENYTSSASLDSDLLLSIVDTTNPLIEYGLNTETDGDNLTRTYLFVNTTFTESNFKNITYYLYRDSSEHNFTTYNSEITSINFTKLPDGDYTFSVTIFDTSSNFNSTGSRDVTIDTTAPIIAIVPPPEETNAAVNDTPETTTEETTEETTEDINSQLDNILKDLEVNQENQENNIPDTIDSVDDGVIEQTQEESNPSFTGSAISNENQTCDIGCYFDGECYSVDERRRGQYCLENSLWEEQKETNVSCSSDFECISNSCSLDNVCEAPNLFQKIIFWLIDLFTRSNITAVNGSVNSTE